MRDLFMNLSQAEAPFQIETTPVVMTAPALGAYEYCVIGGSTLVLLASITSPASLMTVVPGAILGSLIFSAMPESIRDTALADGIVTGALALLAGGTLGSLMFVASAGLGYSCVRIISRYGDFSLASWLEDKFPSLKGTLVTDTAKA